jgi:hypothetical protein
VRYNPGDLVRIGSCRDAVSQRSWEMWKGKIGVVTRSLDSTCQVVSADAGSSTYDYELLLSGEFIFFHEEELVKVS